MLRADQLKAKIDAAFDAGASGYLVWHINTRNTDGYAIIQDQDDPLIGVLEDRSRTFEE